MSSSLRPIAQTLRLQLSRPTPLRTTLSARTVVPQPKNNNFAAFQPHRTIRIQSKFYAEEEQRRRRRREEERRRRKGEEVKGDDDSRWLGLTDPWDTDSNNGGGTTPKEDVSVVVGNGVSEDLGENSGKGLGNDLLGKSELGELPEDSLDGLEWTFPDINIDVYDGFSSSDGSGPSSYGSDYGSSSSGSDFSSSSGGGFGDSGDGD